MKRLNGSPTDIVRVVLMFNGNGCAGFRDECADYLAVAP